MIRLFSLLLQLAYLVFPTCGQDVVPIIDASARVKEHRFGATGDLVVGEEAMRKIIIQWNEIPGALAYEVCHNCQTTNQEGVLVLEPGEIHPASPSAQRAGRPVFVRSGTTVGRNTFHVRASVEEGKWGPWSEQRIFYVKDPGNALHDDEL